MTPDDAMISAWLDGTLDAEGARHMTDLAARDEAFARRVEHLRRIDDLVRAAVPPEPEIPAELLARLGLAPSPARASVVDLAAVRHQRGLQNAAAPRAPQARGGFLKLAAQVALVAGLGLAVVTVVRPGGQAGDPAADYRTLSSAPAPAAREANALVRFAPGIAEDEASRLAAASGLQLLGKPNQAGAWKAAVAPGRRTATLEALRSDPRVIMAEPLDGAEQ